MSGFNFPGGIGGVDIEDVAAMDGSGNIDVSFAQKQIVKEGSEFPDPESLTTELGDDREGRLGLDQPLTIRLKQCDTGVFDTLEDAALAHTDLWILVKSFATVKGASTPLFTVKYKKVMLNDAKHAPVKVDRSTHGVTHFAGLATGYRTDDIMEITHN